MRALSLVIVACLVAAVSLPRVARADCEECPVETKTLRYVPTPSSSYAEQGPAAEAGAALLGLAVVAAVGYFVLAHHQPVVMYNRPQRYYAPSPAYAPPAASYYPPPPSYGGGYGYAPQVQQYQQPYYPSGGYGGGYGGYQSVGRGGYYPQASCPSPSYGGHQRGRY